MDDDAEDILALMDLMGLKDIHMVAQSIGGDVAFRVAASVQICSQNRHGGLVGSRRNSRRVRRSGPSAPGAARDFHVADVLTDTVNVMFGVTIQNDPARADIVALWTDRVDALPQNLRPAMLGVMTRKSALDLLPLIACPVLIFSGAEDHARPPEWGQEVADSLPNSELVVLDRVGHSPTLEVPEVVPRGSSTLFPILRNVPEPPTIGRESGAILWMSALMQLLPRRLARDAVLRSVLSSFALAHTV